MHIANDHPLQPSDFWAIHCFYELRKHVKESPFLVMDKRDYAEENQKRLRQLIEFYEV